MKKFFFAACMVLTLSACSEVTDQVEVASRLVPIGVEVYTQGNTRADDTNATTLQSGFKLLIRTGEGENAINKTVDVTYTEGKYNLSEEIYWPLDGSQEVQFLAYYGAEATAENSSVLTVDNREKDVVVAKATGTLDQNQNGIVALSFEHILSKVSINVKMEDDNDPTTNYTVTLDEFSFTSASSKLDTYNMLGAGTNRWSSSNNDSPQEEYFKVTTKQAVTTTASSIGSNLLVGPQAYTITAKYTVAEGQVSHQFTRSAEVLELNLGSAYTFTVTLSTKTPLMGINVTEVSDWNTTGNNDYENITL